MSFKKYLKETEDPFVMSRQDAVKYNNPGDVDDIGMFYVVTKATPDSELIDVLFPATIKSIMIQGRGGLETDDVVAIVKDFDKAKQIAMLQLDKADIRQGYQASDETHEELMRSKDRVRDRY